MDSSDRLAEAKSSLRDAEGHFLNKTSEQAHIITCDKSINAILIAAEALGLQLGKKGPRANISANELFRRLEEENVVLPNEGKFDTLLKHAEMAKQVGYNAGDAGYFIQGARRFLDFVEQHFY